MENGVSFAVLVIGGTESETHPTPKRKWVDLGQQVSFICNLGRVYKRLCETIGRERIIVIGLLRETISWLKETIKQGHPPCEEKELKNLFTYYRLHTEERKKKMVERYKDMLAKIESECALLLKNGGSDYDGKDVNPETVLDVLCGNSQKLKGPVVPKKGVKSVFFWMNTHGGHHSVSIGTEIDEEDNKTLKPVAAPTKDVKCDICKKPHLTKDNTHEHSSLKTREWFFLLPYRTSNLSLFNTITTAGRNMDYHSDGHKWSPLNCFYWQHIFKAVHSMNTSDSKRNIICLYQFCTAGGHLKWMDNKAIRDFHNTHQWPVFMMATSREQQYSLGFSFTEIFLNYLLEAIKKNNAKTLGTLYDESVKEYWRTHKVEEKHNAQAHTASLKYGEIQFVSGKKSGIEESDVKRMFFNDKKSKGPKKSEGKENEKAETKGETKEEKVKVNIKTELVSEASGMKDRT
mmetsp:Transcript_22856/g.34102  ORF Transcript_22856/g.34102 Transcript_22856/m.34102 type:complete len:460 (-) Transcript_22856:20-1399(-)